MVGKVRLILLVSLTIALLFPILNHASAASPASTNKRQLYLAQLGYLSTSRPTGPVGSTSNLTAPAPFGLRAPLQSSATIVGDLNFSLWFGWTGNSSSRVFISVSFDYRLPAQDWVNRTAPSREIFPGPKQYSEITFTVATPGIALTERATLAVVISSSLPPKNSNVTLQWGSTSVPSQVTIPMSGYETLFQAPSVNPISITDGSGAQTSNFPLDAVAPNNIVLVKALVSSALGLTDIRRVNITIADANSHPVRGESNRDMDPPSLSVQAVQPYQYEAAWSYRPNSTQGSYQIWIDIIDFQNNTAFSFRGPQPYATFQLVPPGFIPFPYNLWPYFIISGVVVSGGVFFYRNRKRRSYLVPFEHFNTLTAGGLEGGTVTTIEGNTGSGKTILAEQLMYEDLRSGRPCVFVSTGDFPTNIRTKMKTMGFDVSGYEQSGLLTFIDGYSSEAGQASREKVFLSSLGDLTTLGMKISSTLPSTSFKGGSLYFDSLSPLTSKAKPESIVSFVQSVGAKVKGLAGKAFFTVGQGIDSVIQRQLEESADCIIQMEAFEESGTRKRRLRIAKLRARNHQEGWTRFTIEDGKGIIFYSRKPQK